MKATDDEEAVEQQLYQSLVGSLLCLYKTRSRLRCRHPCKILDHAKQKSLDSSQTSLEVPEGECQPWHCLHKV